MVMPQPPSVDFEVQTEIVAPAYSRLFSVVLIGDDVGGTASTNPLVDRVVAGPFNDLQTALGRVDSTSALANALRAMFGQDISPSVYLIASDNSLTAVPLRTDIQACIDAALLINPLVDYIYVVDVTENGYKAATAATSVAIAAALEVAAERIDAIAIMDSPDFVDIPGPPIVPAVNQYVLWLSRATSALKKRVRPIFNRAAATGIDTAGGGYFLGAAIRQASRFGRQAGINLAPVLGVPGLKHNLSHSPIAALPTNIKTLVNNYGSAIFQGDSGYEIIGDTFKGYDSGDPHQYWSPLLVIDHALTQARIAAAPFVGNDSIGNTPEYRRGLAKIVNESLDESVLAGELAGARARPHPTRNTAAQRAARRVVIQTFLTVILPTNHVTIEANIEI